MTDEEIYKFIKMLQIKRFRGIFMRDGLPKSPPLKRECGIINLDSKHGGGTHWTAFYKNENKVYFYDSFGDLGPPNELIHYMNNRGSEHGTTNTSSAHNNIELEIFYNYTKFQDYDTETCGQHCIIFLYQFNKIK